MPSRRVAAVGLLLAVALVATASGVASAQRPVAEPHVKVAIEFRQAGTRSRDAVQGSGRVVITERGGVRPRGRVDTDSRETTTRQTAGIFTIVRSGGESTMLVAAEVPYQQIAFYQDYLTGQGYLTTGVAFRQVGTSLHVAATVLPDRKIRLRVTPVASYFTADGAGSVELTRASTELVVASGQAATIAGGTSETSAITRRILGVEQTRETGETTIVLIATIQRGGATSP